MDNPVTKAVNGNNNSWFHCGRCGSLFQSTPGDIEHRFCTECGRSPSLGLEAIPAAPGISQSDISLETGRVSDQSGDREKHQLRKRKKSYLMPQILIGWSVVLVAIVLGARHFWHEEEMTSPVSAVNAPAANAPSPEDIAFLNKASPMCNATFAGFLTAGTPEERNQFVINPITTASRMARFDILNPPISIDPATLHATNFAILNLPHSKAIETLWNTSDGRQLDAVFFQENDEWRLDWEHFVRFSDYPWTLFLASSGEAVGEFRLLARERLAVERKNEDTISIVLYAPRFGSANQTGLQSPEFLIRRDSENGKLLDAAFKMERKGERVFGVDIPNDNPEGLIRLRVKVRRIEENLTRRFELEKIIASHWYSVDEPGVKIPEPPAPTGDGK